MGWWLLAVSTPGPGQASGHVRGGSLTCLSRCCRHPQASGPGCRWLLSGRLASTRLAPVQTVRWEVTGSLGLQLLRCRGCWRGCRRDGRWGWSENTEGTSEKAVASWCGCTALDIRRPGDVCPPEGARKAGSCVPVFCDWKGLALLGICRDHLLPGGERVGGIKAAGDGAGGTHRGGIWFQADILSGKAGSPGRDPESDGDSSQRGKGCNSHIVGKDRPGGRLRAHSAVVSAFTSAVAGALGVGG